MDCLLALLPLLLLASLVTCKVWSFDLYLKKLPCKTVYILTQNSIKHPCSTRDLGPRVLPSLSLSLFLADAGCVTQGILASFLLSLSYRQLWTTRFQSIKRSQQVAPRTGAWYMRHFGQSDSGPVEAGKYKDMGQTAGKPPHFSTLLHHLFKVQGLSVSRQRVEACLQTTVEHYPWFPDEGSFNLEIWHQVKENVERAARRGKIFQLISGPCGLSL